MGLLDEILATKRKEAEALARERHRRPEGWEVRPALAALQRQPGEPLRLIAEIKHRSPSAGLLSRRLSPQERARAYQDAGARMVSVLTDARYFDGSFEHLIRVRQASSLPLLCKDFVISPSQVEKAWASGADAVLVIVRCLPGHALDLVVRAVFERGLEPFVEVTNEAELERALAAGARIVGVNARDLDTLAMDADRAARVVEKIPQDLVAVHLSGLKGPEGVAKVAASRADAALVGEALMRADDPAPLLRAMVERAG